MPRGKPARLAIIFGNLRRADAGLIAIKQHCGLKRCLSPDKFQQIGPNWIGDDQTLTLPVFWDSFREKVAHLELPADIERETSYYANYSRVDPSERGKNPGLEF